MSLPRINNFVVGEVITPRQMLGILLVGLCLLTAPMRTTQTSNRLGVGQDPSSVQTAVFMTFTVSNTGDNGGVDPAPLAGTGTLRQAIIDANANPGADAINFGIPGPSPHVISVLSQLPSISGPVTIDGTTQPGFAGTPIIELSGVGAGPANGLIINSTTTLVRGLVINRFGGHGILMTGSGNLIEGNFIGTNTAGTVALGNTLDGVFVSGGSNNTIGGTTSAARNLISGNRNGVMISGAGTGNQVRGNLIGTNLFGTSGLGNSLNGILISGSSGNAVGAVGSASSNTIAFNGAAGVAVDSGTSNSVLSNSIFMNGGLGIDLGPVGVTPNDAGDGDSGANNLQNFPVITSATLVGTSTAIAGTLNSTANTVFRIEFFSSQTSNPSGFGEGQNFIGSASVTTDASGNANFDQTVPVTVFPGQIVAATATNPTGNTSEFSRSIQLGGIAGGTPADLSVIATITPAPETGSDVTKRITVNNAGPATALSVTVTDVLSGNLSFVSCSSTGGGVCGGSGNTRTITFASLAPNTPAEIIIVARVSCSAAAGAFLSNTASVFSSSTPDNNPLNNMSTATTIAVNPPPRITCPVNITTVNDPGACSAVVNFLLPVVDNCPIFNIVCTPPSGSSFPIGATPVSCVATDGGGATATCFFTVTVNDIDRLAVACPSSITVTASAGNCSPVVTFPAPTVLDNCPGASVSCAPPSGSRFPLGVTNVLCTAVDARGVSATCGFTVTVIGTPQALVRLEGDGPALEFGPIAASRKFRKLKKHPVRTFTVENIGCTQLVLTFASLNRIGNDVDRGFISDPDDRILFNLTKVDINGNEMLVDILTDVVISPGQKQIFKVRFNPLLPAVAGSNRGLSADEALPPVINSVLTFTQNGGAPLRINLIGRIETGVVLIDPENPRRLPVVTFVRNGNEFLIEYSIFDSNLDVDKVVYQFFGKKLRPAGDPFTVDLGPLVDQSNFVRGQSFTISQRVTGAKDHPEILGVSVTVFDGETSFTATSDISDAVSAVQSLLKIDFSEIRLFPTELILPGGKGRTR